MKLEAFDNNNNLLGSDIVYSVGGGDIVYEKDLQNKANAEDLDIYDMTELSEINI